MSFVEFLSERWQFLVFSLGIAVMLAIVHILWIKGTSFEPYYIGALCGFAGNSIAFMFE